MDGDDLVARREQMVRDQIAGRGVRDPAVLAAMRQVPREAVHQPGAALSRLRRRAAADRGRADDLAALHRRPDARGGDDPPRPTGCSRSAPARAMPAPSPSRIAAQVDRDRAPPRPGRQRAGAAGAPRLRQGRGPLRRRQRRLAAAARRSTRSWWPPAGRACPPCCAASSTSAAGSSCRSATRPGTSGWCASRRRGDDGFDEEDLGGVVFVPLIGAHGWPTGGER